MRWSIFALNLLWIGVATPLVASAQATDPSGSVDLGPDANGPMEEIVVTARKRPETALSVPVVLDTISGEQIAANGGVPDLTGLSELVPSLIVQEHGAGTGGYIALRGIGSSTSVASVDQAVSVSIDGVQVSYAGVVKVGQLDLEQMEVLKGPQGLYFGKNSSGGVISLTSADPTPELEASFHSGYEANAEEVFVEGVVSGPISRNLGARVAARYSNQDGYLDNVVPQGLPGVSGPSASTYPGDETFAIRGTLLYDPTPDLSVRLKASYNSQDSDFGFQQRVFCESGEASGPAAIPGIDDCEPDDKVARGDVAPSITQFSPRFGDGALSREEDQALYIVNVDYDINESVSLSSTTGFYDMEHSVVDDLAFGPISFLGVATDVEKETLSQELRITTSFDSPLNGMVGLYYEDDEFSSVQLAAIPGLAFPEIDYVIDGETISGFGQLIWDITDRLELSGGFRYTDETKKTRAISGGIDVNNNLRPDKVSFDNLSPEVTLAWRPNSVTTLFAAYKEGYKAGGFQLNGTPISSQILAGPLDVSFDEETVQGGEVGLKALFFDGTLRADFAVYNYEYDDLQLARFNPITLATELDNVGKATTKGFEGTLNYAPPSFEGLMLSGSLTYNKAEYDEYIAGCYTGQTLADGCNIDVTGDGIGNQQDLSGTSLPRAPEWSGRFDVTYEWNLSEARLLRVGMSTTYTDEIITFEEAAPSAHEGDVWKFNASVAIRARNDRWELALIGKNLTDEFNVTKGAQVPFTGNAATTGTSGPGVVSDVFGNVSRPRSIWAELTVRLF